MSGVEDFIIFERNAISNFTFDESSYDFLLLICWKVFQNLIFPEHCQHTKKLWIICAVSAKGIKSLFSLRSDIKIEISVQKTNKGCTSCLADSQSFLQRKSCVRYQCAKRETHFDSAKFDVHPLFVFCMPDVKLVVDS